MNLRQLRIFHSVSQEKSMSATAEKLHITQPAISQTIANLEQELEVKLFERLNRRLVLTNTGQVLLDYSTRILNLVEEAEQTIEDINNLEQGTLRIGASMTIGTYLLPAIINKFHKQYPKLKIKFVIDNTAVIEKMVLENEIDLGLVEGPTPNNNIIREAFFDDHLLLICAANHHWAKQEIIKPSALKDERFIMREKGSGTREVIANTLAQYQLDYTIYHTLNNIDAIKKAVISNMGISILPKISIQQELENKELAVVEMEGIQFQRKFNFIYHRDKYKSQLFTKFMNYVKEKSK
ncbi:selenium metabolism-associated LysR family transcriptional regulator [Halanaerobacter jeridensis]|uniref:DNA-binding transcriptional LysR family regulator n=1 Tax=Halanaerobacter jeridensis TaxID=706427 RepID=A0A938XNG7_9FIRM|nr:selenium metabolism-associated LysR family transcriptional regulator [Halanaerobacter jeridensis]MBM7555417.1 DNA-binding transcriptional LysR family regulator [Halanaerobacter jeridensis]